MHEERESSKEAREGNIVSNLQKTEAMFLNISKL
jgi:hypothetical protein